MPCSAYLAVVISCAYLVVTYGQQTFVEYNEDKPPRNCNTNPGEALNSYTTVEDFDRCAPYLLPDYARNYFQATAVRKATYRANKLGYRMLQILPKMLRDVSNVDFSVRVLGNKISMPIAVDPVAFQKLASDLGEVDTVKAVSEAGTVMIMSSLANTLIEDVARAAPEAVKWMQVYIFPNRTQTTNLIERAEAAEFKAIVVTVDSPIPGPLPDNARGILEQNPKNATTVNLFTHDLSNPSLTFRDLSWLKRQTRLPIVAKGILTPQDAVRAVLYGASAILVSNHGGRQLDYDPATIDALPKIVDALRHRFPSVEVYVDGGVRNGLDVFKALSRGAKCVFVGRPAIWGLAAGGQQGVSKVLNILRTELNQTMMLAGTPNVRAIERSMVVTAPYYGYLSGRRNDPYIVDIDRNIREE